MIENALRRSAVIIGQKIINGVLAYDVTAH